MLRREFLQCVAAFAASAAALRAAKTAPETLPEAKRRFTEDAEAVLAAISSHGLRPVGLLKRVRGRRGFSIVYVAGEPNHRLAIWEMDELIRHYQMISAGKARISHVEVINRGCGCRIDYEVSA